MAESQQKENFTASVLLVEDDTFLMELMGRKLRQFNLKVLIAINTNDAREVLEKEPVDVILLDIVLPGKNGITFLKELKEDPKYKEIPVIMVSNLGQKEEIERGMEAGAVHYLIKANSTTDDIVAKVLEVFNKK
ncbi:MAG: response regulator [Parcubacteria group bacterium]